MVQPGKRELHKERTRAAIEEVAARLFDERGFAETTVRDIAQEAGVTERTFFRYFPAKEDLLTPDIARWGTSLAQAIREGPSNESGFAAVLAAGSELGGSTSLQRLFADGPPALRGRVGAHVPVLFQLEQQLIEAVLPRFEADPEVADAPLAAGVTIRCLVAAARSAGIRYASEPVDRRRPLADYLADAVRQVGRLHG